MIFFCSLLFLSNAWRGVCVCVCGFFFYEKRILKPYTHQSLSVSFSLSFRMNDQRLICLTKLCLLILMDQ